MVRVLLLLCLLQLPFAATAQLRDSFDDGELLNNPRWFYNAGDFDAAGGQLKTANANGGTVKYGISALCKPDSAVLFNYDFQFQFNPSSQNYVEFYLTADTFVERAQNGYFVRTGDLKDEISFYKLSNGIRTEIISGTDGELNKTNNQYKISVERRNDTFFLHRMNEITGIWVTEGWAVEPGFKALKYSGLHIVQNGTSVIGKHSFDNIFIGRKSVDSIKPKMLFAQYNSPNEVRVTFSEPVKNLSTAQFSLQSNVIIGANVDANNAAVVILNLQQIPAKNQYFILSNNGTADLEGNLSNLHSIALFTKFADTAVRGELYFSEVMANPVPSISVLPEAEYIEIFNPTKKVFTLKGYKLTDGSSTATLPDSVIMPGSYLSISKSTANLRSFGPWVGVSSLPSLNNSGDKITLINHRGELIATVEYNEAWHDDGLKKAGGWSLELIDTAAACISQGNWRSNASGGGTPGKRNSVAGTLATKPDFYVNDVYVSAIDRTELHLSSPADSAMAMNLSSFRLKESGDLPSRFDGLSEDGMTMYLRWPKPFKTNKVEVLEINGLRACTLRDSVSEEVAFGLAENSEPDSIFINELLFDPKGDGYDFAEIYNAGTGIVELEKLVFSNANDTFKTVYTTPPMKSRCLLPGEFVVLTENAEQIKAQYKQHNKKAFYVVSSLPTMSNDEGRVKLMSKQGKTLDSFYYKDNYHSPVLDNPDGVSLEKTQPDGQRNDASYWTSATASAGFATPGLHNSQLRVIVKDKLNYFTLAGDVFSPDNDGNNDLMSIAYFLPDPGYYITATLFSETGFTVARPFVNYSVEQKGTLYWDGKTDRGVVLPGNYIVFIEAFNQKGNTIKEKLTVSVNRF